MAGCSASGSTPASSAGASTARPCAPEVWKVSWPRAPGAGLGQAGDQAGQGVVGHGEDDEVGGGDHLVGGQQRDAGQQAGGALGGGGGEARGGDDVVAGGGERGAQDGADAAGADDAHAEAGGGGGGGGQPGSAEGPAGSRHRCTSRSSPWRVPDVGRGPHRRGPRSCWSVRCVRGCRGAVLLQPDVSRRSTADRRVCDRLRPPRNGWRLCAASPAAPGAPAGGPGAPTVGAGPPSEEEHAWARWRDGPPW